jgi:hypothetical protein
MKQKKYDNYNNEIRAEHRMYELVYDLMIDKYYITLIIGYNDGKPIRDIIAKFDKPYKNIFWNGIIQTR